MQPASVRRLQWIIALAGVVPFAAATVAMLWGDSHIRVPAIAFLVTLSAIAISHIGGVQAGLALRDEHGNQAARAVAITIAAITSAAGWGVLWLPSPQYQLAGSLALFVASWLADIYLSRHGLAPAWLVRVRTTVTVLLAVVLAIALWLL